MGWGDELMVTGHARELQARDPRKVRVVYERPRWHEAWENNPRIARKEEKGDFQEYVARHGYNRPYIADKQDHQWKWKAYGPPRGEIYFSDEERAFGAKHAGLILIEPRIKAGASPNKDWGRGRWEKLIFLAAEKGITFVHMTPLPKTYLRGVKALVTPSMRHAAAVMANARAAVLPEGGLHHVAAAVGTPAMVIFGGYIAPAVTGYPEQTNLFTGEGLGCGMRVPCQHCERAMRAITPEHVLQQLEELLEKRRRSVVA